MAKRILIIFLALFTLAFPTKFLTADAAVPSSPTVEPETVYSTNNIEMVVNKLAYDSSWGGYYAVYATIKNNADHEISYSLEYEKVNGYQIKMPFVYGDIFEGMEADIQISFDPDELALANIEHIMEIEFSFSFYENSNDLIDKTIVSLRTSDYGVYEQEGTFAGAELYNENGIRILGRLGDSNEEPAAVFYVENNTNSKISISYSDLGVNNKMILSFLSGTHVEPDSKSVVSLARYMLTSFYDGEIPENKDINSIILKFHITPFRSDGSFSTADTIKTSAVKITR